VLLAIADVDVLDTDALASKEVRDLLLGDTDGEAPEVKLLEFL